MKLTYEQLNAVAPFVGTDDTVQEYLSEVSHDWRDVLERRFGFSFDDEGITFEPTALDDIIVPCNKMIGADDQGDYNGGFVIAVITAIRRAM